MAADHAARHAPVPLVHRAGVGDDRDLAAAVAQVAGDLVAAPRDHQLVLLSVQHQQRRPHGAAVAKAGDAGRVERGVAGEEEAPPVRPRGASASATLRHTFALGYLRDNPGKLLELSSLLGHESLDTTAIYTRPSRDDLAADLERSHLNVDG
jgi:integrase